MVAAVAAAAAVACTPVRGLGSLAYTRGGHRHVVDLGTCRDRVAPAQRRGVFRSPDGRWTATLRESGKQQTIEVTARGKRGYAVLTLPRAPGPLMLLGWSGDSKWVFYAIDPMGSASLIADGIRLRAVSIQEGGVH